MSYLGRLGTRASGTAAPVGLAPAGRLASPFARIDQRLNLFVQWGTPLGRGTLLGGAADAPGAERAADEAAAPSLHVPPPQPGAPAPRHEGPTPAIAMPAVHTTPAPSDAGSRGRPPSARPSVRGEPRSPEGALPAVRSSSPQQPSASSNPTARARRSERTPNDATRRGEPSTPAAEPKQGRRGAEAPVSIVETASDPSGARALQQALDRVNAWMSKSPRDDLGASRETPEPVAERAQPETTPERRAPAVFTPPASPAASPPARERRMTLPLRAAEAEAAPRLTIGSIEVRVVPPAPPPVVVQAPRERTRVAAPAPQGSARVSSHLTFGLRQR